MGLISVVCIQLRGGTLVFLVVRSSLVVVVPGRVGRCQEES